MTLHDYVYKSLDEVKHHAESRGWKYTTSKFGGKMYNKGNQLVARTGKDGEDYYVDNTPI